MVAGRDEYDFSHVPVLELLKLFKEFYQYSTIFPILQGLHRRNTNLSSDIETNKHLETFK